MSLRLRVYSDSDCVPPLCGLTLMRVAHVAGHMYPIVHNCKVHGVPAPPVASLRVGYATIEPAVAISVLAIKGFFRGRLRPSPGRLFPA